MKVQSKFIEKFSEGGRYYYEPLKKEDIKKMDGYDVQWDRKFENTNTFGKAKYFSETFSFMMKRDKKMPTYYEFIEESLQDIEENWSVALDQPYKKELVKERAGRGYSSFIIEKQVEVFYRKNFENAYVWTNKNIDINFGVDVVFTTESKKNIYIHITKNTLMARKSLKRKGDKVNSSFSESSGHLVLFYDFREDKRTFMAGNQPLLKEEYLIMVIENMINSKHIDRFDDYSNPKRLLRILPNIKKVLRNI